MTKADTSVKFFHSDMPNAPVLQAQAGSLLGVLDACLINGFDSRAVNSIVVAGGVATLTISAGHAFEKHAVIEIAGADQAALNGQWKVASATPSALTFACPGIADVAATGTITAKRAGLGWVKPFADAGTHRAVYQSADLESTRLFLYVDDANTRYTRVRGYEQVNSIDDRVTPFPTFAQVADNVNTWVKVPSTTGGTPRAWMVVGDGRIFYIFFSYQVGYSRYGMYLFGDMVPLLVGDAYHCMLTADATAVPAGASANANFLNTSTSAGTYTARASTQTGSAQNFRKAGTDSDGTSTSVGLDGKIHLYGPRYIKDGASSSSPLRGICPGYASVEENSLVVGRAVYEDAPQAFFLVEAGSNGATCALDIVGPWR